MFHQAVGLAQASVEKFIALEGVDRALALAAQAFAALFPALILVAALEPTSGKRDMASNLIDQFGLEGDGAQAVRTAFAAPEAVTGSVTVISVILVVFSALAFTRALQRLYERAWGLDSRGLRSTHWGLGWLVIFSLYWVIVTSIGGHDREVISLALAFGLWLITPYMLLERRIAWQQLVPQALLTAVCILAVGIGSSIYMSRAVSTSAEQFGVVGVSFALLTWLVTLAFAIVIATAVGTATHDRFLKTDD